jgi:hypothetical protein
MTDEETVLKLAEELRGMDATAPVYVKVTAEHAFSLLSVLQLAWRHPQLSKMHLEIIEAFGRQLQSVFRNCPTASRIAEAGWDRGQDVPWRAGQA